MNKYYYNHIQVTTVITTKPMSTYNSSTALPYFDSDENMCCSLHI